MTLNRKMPTLNSSSPISRIFWGWIFWRYPLPLFQGRAVAPSCSRRSKAADKAALLKRPNIQWWVRYQTLDLSRLELNQIPDEVSQFKRGRRIGLELQPAAVVRCLFLHRFQELRFLNLACNALSGYPIGCRCSTNYREIDLRKNRNKAAAL